MSTADLSLSFHPLKLVITDPQLFQMHLRLVGRVPLPPRGVVNVDLVVALAKLEEAESADEAIASLSQSETFEVLASEKALRLFCQTSLKLH